MKVVFADTFYFLALLNRKDEAHERCRSFASRFSGSLVTTEFVLIELADAIAATGHRVQAARFIEHVRTAPNFKCIASSSELFTDALDLYRVRPDKEWTLTDCASFVVMQKEGMREAATGDHHFAQAGYDPIFL